MHLVRAKRASFRHDFEVKEDASLSKHESTRSKCDTATDIADRYPHSVRGNLVDSEDDLPYVLIVEKVLRRRRPGGKRSRSSAGGRTSWSDLCPKPTPFRIQF